MTWRVEAYLTVKDLLNREFIEWDSLEKLAGHTSVISVEEDREAGSLIFVIEARTPGVAAAGVEQSILALSKVLGSTEIVALRVKPADITSPRVRANKIPPLVGLIGIAELAKTLRHYGREVSDKEGFPKTVTSGLAGPLWVKSEVLDWLETSNKN